MADNEGTIEEFAEAFEESVEDESAEQEGSDVSDVEDGEPSEDAAIQDVEEAGDDDGGASDDDGEDSPEPEAEETSDDPYAGLIDEPPVKVEEKQDEKAEFEGLQQLQDENKALKAQLMQAQGLMMPDDNLRDPDHESYDPDEYNRQLLKFEKQSVEIQKYQREQEIARATEVKTFLDERDASLKESRPHLFGEKGPQIIDKMREVALAAGVTDQQFALLPAGVVELLDDALRYRAGQKALEKAKTTKPASKIVRKSSRKGPDQASQAKQRLAKEGTVDAFASAFEAGIQG